MPIRRRVARKARVSRPGLRKRLGMRKRYGMKRRGGNVSDYATASVSSTITPTGGGNFASNIMYSTFQNNGIKLSDFPRAVEIAKNYQHYKIKQVKLTLKWGYDTFQSGNPGGSSRPALYYMIDKSSSISQQVTLEDLKQMGAKPHTCDNRQFVITWRPAVLTNDNSLAGAPYSQYKISPWLSTNPGGFQLPGFVPSTVEHNGIYWFVEQLFGGGVQYQAEIEVQFAFKKPLFQRSSSSTQVPTGIALAVQNDSPDGIVGGGDGR